MIYPQTIIAVAASYAILGLIFGVAFVWFGVHQIDPAARGAGLGFRFLILPGAAALWPVMAKRWFRASTGPILSDGYAASEGSP